MICCFCAVSTWSDSLYTSWVYQHITNNGFYHAHHQMATKCHNKCTCFCKFSRKLPKVASKTGSTTLSFYCIILLIQLKLNFFKLFTVIYVCFPSSSKLAICPLQWNLLFYAPSVVRSLLFFNSNFSCSFGQKFLHIS